LFHHLVNRVVLSVGIGLSALIATPALAGPWVPKPATKQPSEDEINASKQRYEKGMHLYEVEQDITGGLTELEHAYEIAPNYKYLFNIAQVAQSAHEYVTSLRSWEGYLAGGDVPAERKETALKQIGELKGLVAEITVTTNTEGASVLVDDSEEGKAPVAPFLVNVGPHKITVTMGAKSESKRITVAGGSKETVDLPLQVETVVKPIETPKPKVEPKTSYVWVGWLLTGTFTAGAVATGIGALSVNSSLKEDTYVGDTIPDDIDSKHTTRTALAATTDVLIGVAAITGVVTLYFTIKGSGEDAPADGAPKPTTALRVSPTGLELVGSF
jgi:hypothetical protein